MIAESCYYTSDGKVFGSKIEASKQYPGSQLLFYYNDTSYSKMDWSIEPPLDIEFYYKDQAQRIRDTYDYVVLFYSGGVDSTNILETFHFNNIKLDKIVCVGAYSQDSFFGSDENRNKEIYDNCYPYLKELNLTHITQFVDYSSILMTEFKTLSVYSYGDEWPKQLGAWYSPTHWFWRDIERFVVPADQQNKKVALILGIDKPNLMRQGDKFLFRFNDLCLSSHGNISGRHNVDRIKFYWDVSYPNILIKQLHIVKRHMIANNPGQVADFVYNLRKPLNFISQKSPSTVLSLRDLYLQKHKTTEVYDFFKSGLKYINSNIDRRRLSIVYSRPYFI